MLVRCQGNGAALRGLHMSGVRVLLYPLPRFRPRTRTLIMAETLGTRVTRLEEAMIRLANAQAHLAEVQAADETGARERQAANEAEIRALKMEALEREKRI